MFTTLTLAIAIGAPVPNQPPPVPAGTAPRVMELKPDANGKITLPVLRTEIQKVTSTAVIAGPGGGPVPGTVTREIPVTRQIVVEISEVRDLTITTVDGMKLDKDEALKKLTAGKVVVVSGDGKPVSPAFLSVFRDETLVLASPELITPHAGPFPGRGGASRPMQPVAPPGALPVPPGGVQIQIAPGGAPVVPAQPVPVGSQPAVPAPRVIPRIPILPVAPVPAILAILPAAALQSSPMAPVGK